MLLGRLRIRGKLALLLLIPLLTMAALTVPIVVDRIGLAGRAAATAQSVRLAGRVGSLVQELQRERLLSIGYRLDAVDKSRLVLQSAAATDRVNDIRASLGAATPAAVSTAIDAVAGLRALRSDVLGGRAGAERIVADFGTVITRLIDSLRLMDGVDIASPEGRQVVALDALLHADEATASGTALMVIMVASKNPRDISRYSASVATLQSHVSRFAAFATEEQNRLYALVTAAFAARTGPQFGQVFDANPGPAIANLSVNTLFPALESFSILGGFVEKKIISDVTAVITTRQDQETAAGYGVGGLVVAVLVLVVLLSVAVARAVARPLTRLTGSAERVARVAEAELVRVADDESESAEAVHLEPVDVRAKDEIGDLARAFERVQTTAARLVERQVLSRRNVAQMFGHVGRRTQNLVGRQIAVIDQLEHNETDGRRLEDLYRLDHLSTRLRRNASSLVVLSGSDRADEHLAPLRLGDVIRLALGEIEEYPRVDINVPIDVAELALVPSAISDVVLMLAELMENATSFSPPHTRVSVFSAHTPDGVQLVIVDRGIGLSQTRLAEENARLARRERLDLVPTQVLGLFVVGRLARRHRMGVALSQTPGGGVTATIDLGEHLLARPARVDTLLPVPAAEVPAAPAALALTGWPMAETQPPADRAVARAAVAVPGLQPSSLDVSSPDISTLDRVSHTLETGRPWNAFAVPPPAVPPPAAVPPAALPSAVPPQARLAGPNEAPSVFRRRVPGAQLAANSAGARVAPPPAPVDAEAARALVEQFEAGVRQAEQVRPSATLSRRVPGATLSALPSPDRSRWASQPAPDPDRARDSIEQFEAGVAQALREARTDHEYEEGSSR